MMLKEQDILGNEESVKKFLQMVPDDQLRSKLEGAILKCRNDSAERWKVFEELAVNTKNKVLY